jgi:hypothetical protein
LGNPTSGGIMSRCVTGASNRWCKDAQRIFLLHDLRPDARYEITNFDTGDMGVVSGKDLMEQGLPVDIGTQPGAAIIVYRRMP